MIPLYGLVQGDTMVLLMLADENETVARLAQRLQQAARLRVQPFMRFEVVHNDQIINQELTVAAAGLTPLDHFMVRPGS